ncbi:DMT family transporter [Curvibacter sp. HBC61]|uniref:DMT family transporter n=1 Tax=Curvibacter cyanobacteriorum TaxID=3026422 RepID=A0ABT5N5I9_9BURK|nr:DMT family transporter [Curvibacter sp. HBC61]MDD0840352.1 DMT family transporter [Curvibacter sp. HBC61]
MPSTPSPAPATPLFSVLALMFNAFVWGVSWWPLRQLEQAGLHPLWATALIYLMALGCTLLAFPSALRQWLDQPALWGLALAAGLTNVCFNWAVTVGDVVRVVLLFYLMPLWAGLLAWWLLGERPRGADLLRMGLALGGVAVVLKAPGSGWPVPESLSDWLGLTGGFSFALTNVMLRRLHQTPAPARVLAMFGGGSLLSALTAGVGLSQGLVTPLPAPDLAWLAGAAALSMAYLGGNVALQYGASRLRSSTTALVMLSEVLFASASAVALGAAELPLRVWLGGALIVAAAAWSAWAPSQPPTHD